MVFLQYVYNRNDQKIASQVSTQFPAKVYAQRGFAMNLSEV